MQESASPDVAGETRGGCESSLTTGEIEAILGDFRSWLSRLPNPSPSEPPAETVDLMTLVRGFTALRQEVNLQTRAVRTQSEQAAQALAELTKDVDESPKTGDNREARSLLNSLLDARDSLALARAHVDKSRQSLAALTAPPAAAISLPAWVSWLGVSAAVRRAILPLEEWSRTTANASAAVAPMLDSILTGYSMSLQRLDRSIEQSGLRRIECVGKPFDSEIMEVVEVVSDASRSSSEVIEVVRSGYLLNGTVFRFAQVRVARS